jgi:hypothetical protein
MLHESLVLFKQITTFCVTTSEYTLDMARNENDSDSDEGAAGSKGKGGKARRELPAGAVATLKAWLLSPEHFTHPYPTPQDQVMLMQQTGIDKKQLKNWFTNARRRIWKPMIKKQLERGEVIPTGTASGMAMPGVVPGVRVPPGPASVGMENVDNPHSAQAMQSNYQQAVQQQDQPHQVSLFLLVTVNEHYSYTYTFSLSNFITTVRFIWESNLPSTGCKSSGGTKVPIRTTTGRGVLFSTNGYKRVDWFPSFHGKLLPGKYLQLEYVEE